MYLPSSPTPAEQLLYVHPHKTALVLYNVVSLAAIATAGALFASQSAWLAPYSGYLGLYTGWLGLSYAIALLGRRFCLQHHQRMLDRYGSGYEPESVDVLVPNCGEDLAVLENTFAHARRLKWPRVRWYCLDDRNRPEVRALAERYGFVYYSRPDAGYMAKAGNLKYGFEHSDGDYILVLDADFAVDPWFIHHTIVYMRADPQVATVQTPQFFETRDPRLNDLARSAGYVQELFYRLVQTVRDTWGAAVCCGTSALYRRRALQAVGGFYQIQHSEDVNTGFRLVANGWRIKYIPLVLSKGLCPDRWCAYFTQQYRWAMGSLSLCFSRRFWCARVPGSVRLAYLSGMLYYACTALAVVLTPLHVLVQAWWFPQNLHWYNPVWVLPALVYTVWLLPAWHRSQWRLCVWRLPVVYSYAHLFAIRDLLTGDLMPWQATGAVTKTQRYRRFRQVLMWYSVAVALVTYAGLALATVVRPWYDVVPSGVLTGFWLWLVLGVLVDDF